MACVLLGVLWKEVHLCFLHISESQISLEHVVANMRASGAMLQDVEDFHTIFKVMHPVSLCDVFEGESISSDHGITFRSCTVTE